MLDAQSTGMEIKSRSLKCWFCVLDVGCQYYHICVCLMSDNDDDDDVLTG